MKKLAIAGASVALAAMPVVGVFAATGQSFTDTLNVSVAGGCTIEDSTATSGGAVEPGTYSDTNFATVSIPAGNVGYINADSTGTVDSTRGKSFKIMCNETPAQGGEEYWQVKITGSDLVSTTDSNDTIAPGAATSGDTSGWAVKSNASGNNADYSTSFSNPFAAYTAVTTAGTEQLFLQADVLDSAVTFNPSYRVYVAPSQEEGLYTGTALYTVYLPD